MFQNKCNQYLSFFDERCMMLKPKEFIDHFAFETDVNLVEVDVVSLELTLLNNFLL